MRGERYLTGAKQFALVCEKGSSWATDLLVMRVLPNGLNRSRYGFSVSQRVGKAVTRNRVKRRLREILRITPLLPGWDIVFIVRPPAAGAKYAELKRAVDELLCRAELLTGEYEKVCLDVN